MLNLLNFLRKYYAFFLFLILEAISIGMLTSHGHQSAVFAYTSNQMGGEVFSSWQSITHYFTLGQANEQLATENIALRNQLAQSYLDRNRNEFKAISFKDDSLQKLITDDSLTKAFDYLSAKVISNSVHKPKNYLMLNKGRKQGIRENMGVIGPNGGVGIVYSVSDDFCTAVSFINTDTRISAKLLSSQEIGSLRWDGRDHQIAQLTSIETYIPIHVGDTVVTSGFSHIFPEGVLLGTIKDYHTETNATTYSISLKLSTHFSRLQYVSIVRNKFYSEQKELEKLEGEAK
jgi:rod shape-determining protein MreC